MFFRLFHDTSDLARILVPLVEYATYTRHNQVRTHQDSCNDDLSEHEKIQAVSRIVRSTALTANSAVQALLGRPSEQNGGTHPSMLQYLLCPCRQC